MPDDKKDQMSDADMHRRTSLLAEVAGRSGDDFLQYLYGLALAHLEEKSEAKQHGTEDKPATADDPQVKILAERFKRGNDPTD